MRDQRKEELLMREKIFNRKPSCRNYRIIKNQEGLYGIYEVYYKYGKLNGHTEKPMTGYYQTAKEVIDNLEMMLNDVKLVVLKSHQKDILNIEDFIPTQPTNE